MKAIKFLSVLIISLTLFACSKETNQNGTIILKITNPTLFNNTSKIEYLLTAGNSAQLRDALLVTSDSPLIFPKIDLVAGSWNLEFKVLGDSNQVFHYETSVINVIKDKSDTLKLTLGNKASMAAYLDGGVNYVNITATSALNAISDAITMEAWVKPQIQFYNTVIAKGQSDFFIELVNMNPGFYFRGLTIDYTGAVNYYNRLVATDAIPANKWSHIACTYSAQNQSIKIYVNGLLKHSCSASGTIESRTDDLRIGARVSVVYPEYMKGSVDEVRLWNTVRTATQIRDNMAKELTGNENGLIGYWNLNQIVSGTTISDISGHNHNGLLSGSVILIDSFAF